MLILRIDCYNGFEVKLQPSKWAKIAKWMNKMKKIRALLLLGFAILIALNSFGQKIKYKDCKNDFSAKQYRDLITIKKYSPLTAGVVNILVPTLGYYYVEEPLRGVCVLGAALIPLGTAFYGFTMSFGQPGAGGYIQGAEKLFNYGMIAFGLLQVWSFCDVVKIAKIKNLAYQERKIALKIKPEFLFADPGRNRSIACGLSLNISF
jgi:hypothetical protein